MKTSSAKAKGRRLQDMVRDRLLQVFNGLEEDDVKCAIMGETGSDIKLSPLAQKIIPYSFECKNQEKLSIWNALEQSSSNCKQNTSPVVIFKRNRSKTYVVLEFDDFMDMIDPDKKNK